MHIFDQGIEPKKTREREDGIRVHTVRISDGFLVQGTPNGGYLMGLLARQLLSQSDKTSTPIITVNFLTKAKPTESAEIVTRVISRSKQFNRYEARLLQEGKEILWSTGTFVANDLECSLDKYEERAIDVAPRSECLEIPNMSNFSIYDNMKVLLEPKSLAWVNGELGDKSEIKGWIRFREKREFDLCGVLLASDTFPPPIFVTEGPIAWVPTVEMSVNIRNLPVSEWLKCRFRTRHITCGLLEEDGELWDEAGNLVAISRQIAQFRKSS